MLRETKEKIALYAGYIIIMCITFLGYDGMGLFDDCSIQNRLSYPFFHQNIFMLPSTFMFSINATEPSIVASVTWWHSIS